MVADKILLFAMCGFVAASVLRVERHAECCEEYCYETDPEHPQTAHFGERTPYQILKLPKNGSQYVFPGEFSFV